MKRYQIMQQIQICADFKYLLCGRWKVLERISTEKYSNLVDAISVTDPLEAEELASATSRILVGNSCQKDVISLGRIYAALNILSKKYIDACGAKKIFISHSSKDKDIIEIFIEKILRLGCSFESIDIFCTSIEDMGIKTGNDIRKYIQEFMRSCDYVFLMISKNYIDSGMCLNEMGASWALDKKVKPFLFPGLDYSAILLSAALRNSNLNESATLDSLRDELNSEFELNPRSTSDWNKQKNDFLDYLNSCTN